MKSRSRQFRGRLRGKIRKGIRRLCLVTPLTATLHALRSLLRKSSYLKSIGWFESYRRRLPVSRAGEAIPWYTYGATAFLEGRIRPSMLVFEYGSGHSTLWWSHRVRQNRQLRARSALV